MLGFLRKIVASTEDSVDLRARDCHCHAIPGVDDGSRTMDESLAMIRLLRRAGVQTIVCTPHIFPARFPNEPDELREAFARLEQAREAAQIDMALELGAEHYLDHSLLNRIERGEVLAFGAEKYVLFETTTGESAPARLVDVCCALLERGYTPLLAHVERYRYLRGEQGRELCEDLQALGVRFQVNRTVGQANRPGRGPRGTLIAWLLERGFVDEVGSDLHRPTPEGRPHHVTKPARTG